MAPETMDFQQWWTADGQWVEQPNQRRGGESGVLRWQHNAHTYYIKRQTNHLYRSLRYPFGYPTIHREHLALKAMQQLNINVPHTVFCQINDRDSGQCQALLVTQELVGFIDSDTWFKQGLDQQLDSQRRQLLMRSIGQTLATMHRDRWQHGCLYGKHLFINSQTPTPQVALLDFEKARQRLTRSQAAHHDLSQLQRHSLFSEADWQAISQSYQEVHPLAMKARKHH